jgi:hypothetical protein
MHTRIADWRRTLLATSIGALPLTGCHNPERLEGMVNTMEPLAVEAAVERARTDLNCSTVETAVLSREHGDLGNQYNLHRVVYRVEATGCKLTTTYSVACVPNAVCSAISEGGNIRRVQ